MEPVCAVCGRPIRRRGGTGAWVHRARGPVAACDLDSDHAPTPDLRGAATCALCGEPVTDGPEGRRHVAPEGDADHAAA